MSIEYVYLDGGKVDGLRKGDRLMITRGDSLVAILEIRYLSNNSASCLIVEKNGQVFANDVAIISQRGPEEATSSDTSSTLDSIPPATSSEPAAPAKKTSARSPTRTSGTVSAQIYSWADQSAYNVDYLQSTLRLNIRARHIGGRSLNLFIRTRGEYDNRSRAYSSASPEEDWTNRIHELSLEFDDAEAPLNFQVGRILPHRLSGAGYIDGGLLERRMSQTLQFGAFAGLRPRWQYQDQAASLSKYGVYLTASGGNYQHTAVEQSLALSGEYHGSIVSRELAYLQGQISVESRWFFSHSAEIDINRGWRKDNAGGTFTLSNLYLNTSFRASRSVTFGINYDNRRSYWSYETRSIADSLFDDQLRSGVRGSINLRLPAGISFNGNTGYRKRAGDPSATTSYSLSINKSELLLRGSTANVRYASFNGPNSDGSNYGVTISQYIHGSNSIELGYSEYRYTSPGDGSTRSNRGWDATAYLNFARHLFLITNWHIDRGDDTRGTGIRGELGYRL